MEFYIGLTIIAWLIMYLQYRDYKKQIILLKKEQELKIKQSLNTQRAIVRGSITEEIAPLLPDFPYNIYDCKFLSKPIDYVIFDGMSKYRDTGEGEIKIVFLDVKTGKSRLTKVEKAIKEAVENKNIEFKVYEKV